MKMCRKRRLLLLQKVLSLHQVFYVLLLVVSTVAPIINVLIRDAPRYKVNEFLCKV